MIAAHADNRKAASYLYPALILLIGCALIVRCRYGFDWSDEAYYSALAYRLALGDSLFSEMWEMHQLSVIPLLPLVKGYLWLNGSSEGLILFLRTSFCIFETLAALGSYFLLKKRVSPLAAFLAAAILQSFTHFALPNFSYDSATPLLLFLSVLLIPADGTDKKSFLSALLSGALYALAVQCYPQLVISLPAYAVYWICRVRHAKKSGLADRSAAAFLLGVLLLIAAFAVFLTMNSSFAAMLKNIPHLLDDPSHLGPDYGKRFLNYFHTLIVIFGPVFYVALLLTAETAFVSFSNKRAVKKIVPTLWIAVFALGLLSILRILSYDVDAVSKNNFLATSLLLVAPALYFLDGRRKSPFILLYALGFFFSLSAQLFSNMGIYAASFPLILCSLAALCYAAESAYLASPSCKKAVRVLYTVMGIGLLAAVLAFRIVSMHRESSLFSLDTALSGGPADGVITTAESAREYAAIISAIETAAPESGNILVTSMLPFGYACTELLPAAQSVWFSPYNERLALYYSLHPDRIPDLIVAVPEGVGYSYGDGDAGALLDYLKTAYQRTYTAVVDNEYCTVYRLD